MLAGQPEFGCERQRRNHMSAWVLESCPFFPDDYRDAIFLWPDVIY